MTAAFQAAARTGYRPEIDGLCALAIAPVVVHHANPALLPGGFAGVDVFFVISGYLITAIIANELATGRFSLLGFWERRVRRIVPALAAMLTPSAVAAWAILTPEDFTQFAKSLAAASVFASNLHFARGTGYFDAVEGSLPLLHTWTLGVEEQFYLLFPLLVIAARRWKHPALLPLVVVLGLASFALALWLAPRWPLAAFYLLPTRMWELMLGAACALLPQRPRADARLAGAGIALIGAGFWLIGPDTPAPGPLFLLPTIGAALVLMFANAQSGAGRLLAWRPLAGLGMISFGLYLWHQPVLAFAHYVHFGPLPLAATLAAIAAAVGLGALSWGLIEQPVRQRQWLAHPAALLTVCGGALALPLGLGAAGYFDLLAPVSHAEAVRLGGLRPPTAIAAVIEPRPDNLAFVLYGDSHAAQYYEVATARFGPGALVSASGCLSVADLVSRHPGDPAYGACRALAGQLTDLVERRGVRTVIWAQRWERLLFAPGSATPLGPTEGRGGPELLRAMARHADRLPPGTRIVLIGNSPTAWAAGPLLEGGWLRCHAWRNVTCPSSYPARLAEGRAVNAMLRAFAASDPRFTYVDAAAPLCPGGRCQLIQDGTLNFWDGSHMTLAAARRVVGRIDPAAISR